MPVVAGSFLIVGALLGFLFNWLLEGRKASRAAAIRWDDDLRKFAAELITNIGQLRKLEAERFAFLVGMEFGYNHVLDQLSSEGVLEHTGGDTREVYISKMMTEVRRDSNWITERTSRAFAIWNQIEGLQANISLVAPPDIQTALEPLLELSKRWLDAPGKDREEVTGEYVQASEFLVTAIRKHLKVKPLRSAK